MLKRLLGDWALKQQAKELTNWVTALSGVGAEELGFIVAQASNRRMLLLQAGVDVSDPMLAVMRHPDLPYRIARMIQKFQKQGLQAEAPSLMIWLHSLRSFVRPELRILARRMWGELERRFDFAEDAARNFYATTGVQLDLTDFDVFPKGLEPRDF